MSFKTLFDKATSVNALANKTSKQIGGEVESREYHTQDIIHEKRFIPRVDYSDPDNFARYGSAEEYYKQSLARVWNRYPYDGSLKERVEWENDSTYLDLYLFDNLYPRTNGYVKLSANGWGATAANGDYADGYGLPATKEYIYFEGGPHPNAGGEKPYAIQFTGSNYYEPTLNRASNLQLDLTNKGTSLEFWLKKEEFDVTKTEKEVIFDLWNNEDSSSVDYGRFRLELTSSAVADDGADPFRLTVMSGTVGFVTASICSPAFTTESVIGDTWNHYAVTLKQGTGAKSIAVNTGAGDRPGGNGPRIQIGATSDHSPATSWDSIVGGAVADALPFSISAWIYVLEGAPSGGGAASYGSIASMGNDQRQLWWRGNTNRVVFTIVGDSTVIVRSSGDDTLVRERWHHVVGTFEGGAAGAMNLYVNAQKDTGGPSGTPITDSPKAADEPVALDAAYAGYIGGFGATTSQPFPGYLSDISVWNKELSAAEVVELYSNGASTNLFKHSAADNLSAWYPLGDSADKLDGTNVASSTNTIKDVAGARDGFCDYGLMSASQMQPYSPYNNSIVSRFYVNGQLENERPIGLAESNPLWYLPGGFGLSKNIEEVGSPLRATIGSLLTSPSGTIPNVAVAYAGKLSASLDEFRYWKIQRTGKDIGRYWFDQIGGGNNTDPKPFTDSQEEINTNLGVYYKFNEGITGDASIDSTVLDYSGRVSNGSWTGFTEDSRNTGSAIVLSNAAIKEFKDPIIYPTHPDLVTLSANLAVSGSDHDGLNNAMMYKSLPAWISEEDEEGQGHLKKLTQIMASYFDTLQMQTDSLNKLKDVEYISGSNKPLPFADRLLNSHGLVAPEIFLDADILEKLADRSEDRLYEKTLNDLKNLIYQNIYNNLTYIYKSKGTEKSFRNLIRCFGIDDELIKIKLYAQNTNYEFRENRRTLVVPTRYVDFNTADNTHATVFSYQDPSGSSPNSYGYITSSVSITGGFAYTMEADIFFPTKPELSSDTYFQTNVISASLFGLHGTQGSETDTSWPAENGAIQDEDRVNFQVFAVRDELDSPNVKFVLTGTTGGYVPHLQSVDLYEDTYEDVQWNLAVRVKPERYPLEEFVPAATTANYIIELRGLKVAAGEVLDSFAVSGTMTAPPAGFMTGSKRVFVGAHRTNFTGSVLQTSDVKVEACRFWLDYVENEALRAHALDGENHGALNPHSYAYPFINSGSYGDVVKMDTLALNWEFSENTGSNAIGQFVVADESSGSAATLTAYNGLGQILNKQYTGLGFGFSGSSAAPLTKDFIALSRLNEIETIAPAETIQVLSAQEQRVFKIDSRPVNYFFAFEKSMYNTISEEILNYFGTLKDFNNLIGQAANRYRGRYKELAFVRQKFFEKVGNSEIDFDKYYEFYKWFDSSLSFILAQLVPVSTDFAPNIRTMIEDHVLERSKYKSKLPFLDTEGTVFETAISSNVDYGDAISSPDDDAQGCGFYPAHAPTRRQSGLSARGVINKWKYVHAPEDGSQKQGYLWWKNKNSPEDCIVTLEGSDFCLFDTSADAESVKVSRAAIRRVIKSTLKQELGRVMRFNVAGDYPPQGVGLTYNKRPNFVFGATAPFGPSASAENIPGEHAITNIMVVTGSDVEVLLDTTDEFYPTYKNRLGFGLDPDINKNNNSRLKADGNEIAPFNLYKSDLPNVPSNFRTDVRITNMHHDFVADSAIPAQGPFTEKFIGGRQYRHTELNEGSDTALTRAEGWKIQFSGVSSSARGTFQDSLAIVPPNYTGLATLPHVPTAQRLRPEAAKRPVNIKNILMTTASVGTRLNNVKTHNKIGNYQKNYQVIQTSGRSQNDPYFADQSFNFALYPETLATRGRFPLVPQGRKSLHFDADNSFVLAGTEGGADWNDAVGGVAGKAPGVSFSMWFNSDAAPGGDVVFKLGAVSDPAFSMTAFDAGNNRLRFWIGKASTSAYDATNSPNVYTSNLSITTWHHAVMTLAAGTGNKPNIYIDGVLDNAAVGAATTNNIAIDDRLRIGDATNSFDGYICDFAVWNKEFSAAEVLTIYNGGRRINLRQLGGNNRKGDLTAGDLDNLIAWYPLGDDTQDTYNGDINDQMNFADGVAYNFPADAITPVSPPYGGYGSLSENMRGNLDYRLPTRTGPDSNNTVIVNRFSAPGSYEVLSQGYLNPAHEELSVYNALPFRNRTVIDYGLSGSASADPSLANTVRVMDQIDKARGLNQRASLHSARFGIDAAYGSITKTNTRVDDGLGYSETPSWHKTNRNPVTRIHSSSFVVQPSGYGLGYVTASVYDNLFVQHAIPRSTRQYAWVTASLIAGDTIYGLQPPTCYSASSLNKLITGSSNIIAAGTDISENQAAVFFPLREIVLDPVSASSHTLGYPLDAMGPGPGPEQTVTPYLNPDFYDQVGPGDGSGNITRDLFNTLMLNRHGPYQAPSWKQIRTGENPVARKLRETNQIGVLKPPPMVPDDQDFGRRVLGYVRAKQSVEFIDFTEQPLSSRHYPVLVALEDNTEVSDVKNNIVINVTYGNKLDYFSNEGLNNLLNIPPPNLYHNAFSNVVQNIITSDFSTVMNYSERIYPAEINAYKNIVRNRTTFTIKDIWNPVRSARATGLRELNSQGRPAPYESVWPLDANLLFGTSAPSLVTNRFDGAGELQNIYSRFGSASLNDITASALYASRVQVGLDPSFPLAGAGPIFGGVAEWTAAAQAEKDPYERYEDWVYEMRLIGKDHSIVPEYRISEFLDTYYATHDGNFLVDLDGSLTLTGSDSNISNTDAAFFKTYTNADFLKYFEVVDDMVNQRRSGGLKIEREKVSLRCSALLKFLPYKGFYPAERIMQLATLFSQSYGDYIETNDYDAAYRAILEPLFAPGIWNNTVKSGIAVGSWITTSQVEGGPTEDISRSSQARNSADNAHLPAGNICFGSGSLLSASSDRTAQEYNFDRIPFEAVYRPEEYLNQKMITGSAIYDSGIGTASLAYNNGNTFVRNKAKWGGSGRKLYRLAADNFLCETSNFFMNNMVNFVSSPENKFKEKVGRGEKFALTLNFNRTLGREGKVADRTRFEMYDRPSAFGPPFVLDAGVEDGDGGPIEFTASLAPNLPAYYYGTSSVTILTTASYGGQQTIGELFANAEFIYDRSLEHGNFDELAVGSWLAQQVSESFNLTEVFQDAHYGRWAIQSKFETPVFNFAAAAVATPSDEISGAKVVSLKPNSSTAIASKGMWHQYGSLTSDDEGIFVSITTPNIVISPIHGRVVNPSSLAQMVGFEEGVRKKIGQTREEQTLEEAVVAVPFVVKRNRRKFLSFPRRRPRAYHDLVKAMGKYVFPPKFDFLKFQTVRPLMMYVFEFKMDLKQKDLVDIWQNLPPGYVPPKFETEEIVLEDKKLVNKILSDDEELQWMVFKVKKRATKDFDIQRRLQLTNFVDDIQPSIGQYSYNWPYDYFSLVELIKIDETIQYTSLDTVIAEECPPCEDPEDVPPQQGPSRRVLPGQPEEDPVLTSGVIVEGDARDAGPSGQFTAAQMPYQGPIVDPDRVFADQSQGKFSRGSKTAAKAQRRVVTGGHGLKKKNTR